MKRYLLLILLIAQTAWADVQMDCKGKETMPSGRAKRIDATTLGIRTQAKPLVFKNVEDGVSWTYCRYNAKLKKHLILQDDNISHGGVLVDDVTGEQTPGGFSVLFSDDGKFYAAGEQPDGLDGYEITVYTAEGVSLWSGYSFIRLGKDEYGGHAYFEDSLHWNNQQLEASPVCYKDDKQIALGKVKLIQNKQGKWDWQPNLSGKACAR